MNINVNDFFTKNFIDYLMPPIVPQAKVGTWLTQAQLKTLGYKHDPENKTYVRQAQGQGLVDLATTSCFHFYQMIDGKWTRPDYPGDVSKKGLRGCNYLIVTEKAYFAKVRVASNLGKCVHIDANFTTKLDKREEHEKTALWQFAKQWNGDPFLCLWFDNYKRTVQFDNARINYDPRHVVIATTGPEVVRDLSLLFEEAKK